MNLQARIDQLEQLRSDLENQTKLVDVLAAVLPVGTSHPIIVGRLHSLATAHLRYGSALRRLVDSLRTSEEEGNHAVIDPV